MKILTELCGPSSLQLLTITQFALKVAGQAKERVLSAKYLANITETSTLLTVFGSSAKAPTGKPESVSFSVTEKDLGKFCLPTADAAKDWVEGFYEKYGGDNISTWINDLLDVWWITLAAAGIAFVLGFIYMFLLKWMAKPIVFISIVLVQILIILAGYLVYNKSQEMQDDIDEQGGVASEEDEDNQKYVLYLSYAIFALAGIYFIVMLCLCSRIRLAIAIFQVTSDFMRDTPSIFLVPIIFLIIGVIFLAIWIVSAVFIFTVGEAVQNETAKALTNIEWSTTTRYVFLYYLFGLFWVTAFIIGCAQFIIAAAASTWYFSHNGDIAEGKASLKMGFSWIFKFHLGSIAFGSLIIAIVQMVRAMFEYYRRTALKHAGSNNQIVKTCLCITSYCLMCLEKCVKFISKNAYILIAI